MKNKPVPIRTCIGCNEKKSQNELLRIVSFEDKATVDLTRKKPGRGCYICPNEECFEKAIKRKAFQRQFKRNVTDNELESIRVSIKEVSENET